MKLSKFFFNSLQVKFFPLMRKKRVWLPGLMLVIVLVVFFISRSNNNQVEYVTDLAKRGDIKQTVSATGTVQSAEELELSFKNTGWVSEIFVAVGDRVTVGDQLIKLDVSSAEIAVRQAEANVVAAQATLNKMIAGVSREDIKVAAETVAKAQVNYDTAGKELSNLKVKLDQDINTYDKAVATAEDNLTAAKTSYDNTVASQAQSVINLIASSMVTAESQIYTAESALGTIRTIFERYESTGYLGNGDRSTYTKAKDEYLTATTQLGTTKSVLSAAKLKNNYDETVGLLDFAVVLLKSTIIALNSSYDMMAHTYQVAPDLTAATIETYKTNIKTDQSTVNTGLTTTQTAKNNLITGKQTEKSTVDTAVSSVTSADNGLKTAQANLTAAKASKQSQIDASAANVSSTLAALNFAKAQYNQTVAPARSEDIAKQQANIAQLAAALDLAENDLAEQIIKSPIDGIVTKVDYEVGEQVILAKSAVGIISAGNLEIEVDIPESDIIKINHGDAVGITLDAYGDDYAFFGRVASIEPAETVISDVIYYKVKVIFICDQDNITTKDSLNKLLISSPDINTSTNNEKNLNVSSVNVLSTTMDNKQSDFFNSFADSNSCLIGVKSGMSANIVVDTATLTGVLMVPQRAVLSRDDGVKFVRVLNGDSYNEVDIITGLRGDGGMVEVVSGLKEGEEVITYIKNGK